MKPNQIFPTLLALILSVRAASAAVTVSLEDGFLNPPDSAKPQTWWHWMNGNLTKAGITADLEAMKQIGLGGATIVNVDSGIPRGPVPFMSQEWRDDFKFAVQEADRLGLELSVENCAGWSSSGGPWNTPEHAMQRVVTSEVQVNGPKHFSEVVPQPPMKFGFYRDIAVLAFRTPDGEGKFMKSATPRVSASVTNIDGDALLDGDIGTFVTLPTNTFPQFIQLEFAHPFAARLATLTFRQSAGEVQGVIQVSDDGDNFRDVRAFTTPGRPTRPLTFALGSEAVAARFIRLKFTGIGTRTRSLDLADVDFSPRLRVESVDSKDGDTGTAILSSPVEKSAPKNLVVSRDATIDLTSKLSPDGHLDWDTPAGDWTILRIGYTPTGRVNHPAPKEGEGLECDKFSKEALDLHWAGFMQKILDDIGPLAGKTLNTSLIDSYEVGGQNWSANFREEFTKRRGYDLLPFLPAFTGRVVDNPEISERFLWDVRKTIAELFAENYFGHFAELCRQHGLLNAVEPYTGPFESLQCGAPADIVMGEFWSGSQGHPSVKLAASVAHIYGKQIVGAESFTASPDKGRWQNTPYSLKALGDLMYCQGLNRYIFHRYAMQPWTNHWPGMTMGQWGFHFERTSTWWGKGKPWIDYISRCQFLLQQGRAVADVAYFCGESVPVEMRVENPALPAGYDYDAINADVLLHRATVKKGRLTLPSGMSYAALVLPPQDSNMTPELLARIRQLVRAGAIIVGAPSQHSPSLEDFPKCDAQVTKWTVELWGKCDGSNITEHAVGKGRVVWGEPLANVFAMQNLKPDFEFVGNSPDTHLAYAHRIAGKADIYFISNQRTQSDSAECTFRVSGKMPELWHADTGVIERAPIWREQDGRTTVSLAFDPAGSVFVIFRQRASGDHVVTAKANAEWQTMQGENGKLLVKATSNGAAEFMTARGKTLKALAANVPAPLPVIGEWMLNFPPNWGAPPSVTLEKLISWTEHANEGVRYFSGTAIYEKEIEISAERLSAGRELWLDLGEVKNFAEVSLNGKNLGVLWKPPFRVNVTAAAKSGANKLIVKVTNLWPNRLIGDEQLPPDCEWNGKQLASWPQWLLDGKPSPTGRLTFTTWHHWTKDSPLLESGLLGPVTLQTAEVISTN